MRPINRKREFNIKSQSGLGIVEIIVVIAIITTAFLAIVQLMALARQSQTIAHQQTGAYHVARQAFEATRAVRDRSWNDLPDPGSGVITRHPALTTVDGEQQWDLTNTGATTQGIYTYSVEVRNACRDSDGNIVDTTPCSTGTLAADTRHFKTIVEWAPPGGDTRQVDLEMFLTDWQECLDGDCDN